MNQVEKRQIALVTGAAHRVGKAVTLGLARLGYAIGLHYYSSQAEAEQTSAEITAQGGEVVLLQADLRDPTQIRGLFERLDQQPFTLQVLVNSAALMPQASLMEMDAAAWDSVFSLNLRAPWLCSREAAARMAAGGVIINLIDSGFQKLWTRYGAYVLSKNGLEMQTRLLAKELAPTVRVNAVAPGLVLKDSHMADADWQRLLDRLPGKTTTQLESITAAVTFLVQNEDITGETIYVDRGFHLIS